MNRQAGFTLLELVMVITLLGILSISAYSRFADEDTFAVRVEQESLIAALNQAQQLAIIGQTVQFVISSSSVYRVRSGGVDFSLGGIAYPRTIHRDISLSPTSLTLSYDSLGRTSATTITLNSATGGALSVCLENSGYAHGC